LGPSLRKVADSKHFGVIGDLSLPEQAYYENARFHYPPHHPRDMLPLLTDLRQAVRGLRRSPTLATVAITSLAFGIGANVTVYSVVREMILDDLSARQPERLARVDADVSYALYRDLQHTKVFQDVAFYHSFRDWNWQTRTRSEVAWTMTTSANFFDVLGIGPSVGRL
jgi:hypothetical protein